MKELQLYGCDMKDRLKSSLDRFSNQQDDNEYNLFEVDDLIHALKYEPLKIYLINERFSNNEFDAEGLKSNDIRTFLRTYVSYIHEDLNSVDQININQLINHHVELLINFNDQEDETFDNSCKIIELLLLNPNQRFTDIEHAEFINKLIIIKKNHVHSRCLDLLFNNFLAIKANITSLVIPKSNKVLASVSCLAAAALIKSYSSKKLGFWKNLLVKPILKISMLSFSCLVSWNILEHFIKITKNEFFTKKTFTVDKRSLIGSYAEQQISLITDNALLSQIKDIEYVELRTGNNNYNDNCIYKRNILRKYANLKLWQSSSKFKVLELFKARKIKKLLKNLESEYDELNRQTNDFNSGTKIFKDKVEEALITLADKTFCAENFQNVFNDVINQSYYSLGKSKRSIDYKLEILSLHILASRGHLKLKLESMYVLQELVNTIIYNQYKSPLSNIEVGEQSNSFYTFLLALNVAVNLNKNNSVTEKTIESLKNIDDNNVELLKSNSKIEILFSNLAQEILKQRFVITEDINTSAFKEKPSSSRFKSFVNDNIIGNYISNSVNADEIITPDKRELLKEYSMLLARSAIAFLGAVLIYRVTISSIRFYCISSLIIMNFRPQIVDNGKSILGYFHKTQALINDKTSEWKEYVENNSDKGQNSK